jgi:hypothetical protein
MNESWHGCALEVHAHEHWLMFWAACICGVCAAFTTPRQTMPFHEPSEPFAPVTSSRTNWSYFILSYSA